MHKFNAYKKTILNISYEFFKNLLNISNTKTPSSATAARIDISKPIPTFHPHNVTKTFPNQNPNTHHPY